jgi:hypothetical protein
MENLTPVLGYGGIDVIGHWNEISNIFIWKDTDIVYDTINLFRRSTSYPIIVQISRRKHDNVYYTYQSFQERPDSRTILHIRR